MFKFAVKHLAVHWTRVLLVALSIVLSASVALLVFNISQQVSEGIVSTAAYYDIIIGPAGSATQLAMNTMFFTDEPLGTISYEYVEELQDSGLTNSVVPFTMGDSYNGVAIVGTTPEFLDGRGLKTGEMFGETFEAVVGSAVAQRYGIEVGDSLVTSHGLTGSGSEHASSPLKVVGILQKTGTAYDNVIFTSYETVWETHDSHQEENAEISQAEDAVSAVRTSDTAAPSHARQNVLEEDRTVSEEQNIEEDHAEEHDHAESGEVCAILIRSKSFNDYYKLMEYYGENAALLCINPSTVLREVLEQVDLSSKIVYVLCGIIFLMNLVVISVITLLNMYDAQKEIALMRLIGVGMKRIGKLYLIENGLMGLAATAAAFLLGHGCLKLMSDFVASMGIVLNAGKIYGAEWGIMAAVLLISVLPTLVRIGSMSRKDGLR